MKKITLLFTLLAFSFGFSQQGGVDCANAVVVTAGAVTGTTIVDTTVGTNSDDFSWFSYTATSNGTLIITSCGGGSDTDLALYDNCAGGSVAANDDFCDLGDGNPYASEVSYDVINGTTYYIQWIDTWELGPFDWSITLLTCTPPSATVAVVDDCGNSQFTIDVDVTDMGDSATLTLSNSFDVNTVNVTGTGTWTAGPFPIGSAVSVTLEHENNTDCDASSGLLADTCPPINDECTGAVSVACDDVVAGSTVAATDSGGNAANDVWFSYTGSGPAEDVTLTLCNSGYDTAIRVYTDCPATNQVLFNDDACGVQSEGTFASDGTTTYYIMVEGYATSAGSFEMSISCAANVPAPANDLCANAEVLALDVLTAGTTAGATDNSTGATDDTSCEGFTFKSDVWFTFVALDTDVNITTTLTGDSDQANVAVYSSVDCSQLDVDSIACSNGNGGESINVTGLTPTSTYSIRVWSDGVAARSSGQANRVEGTFTITVNDATLSTNDFDANQLFTYFPNPVNNALTLNAQNEIQNVTVYNMLGQEVLRTSPNTLNSEIDMSAFQSGAYFVKVTINKTTETIRIIKR